MGSKNYQIMEMSLRIKDDPAAGLLLEQFLSACFDSVPPPDWAPTTVVTHNLQTNVDRISTTLNQLNAYLKDHAILPRGIHPPRNISLNDWAEDITMQILGNGPF